jgi:hypothetical protein
MTKEELSTPEAAEPLKARVVGLFGQMCAKPDDVPLARVDSLKFSADSDNCLSG